MDFTEETRLKDILAEYPWLPDKLIELDERFRIINNPIGRMLIRSASLGDACKRAGYPVPQVIGELKKLIAEQENGDRA